MEVSAHLKSFRMGPRKVRLLAALVSGLTLAEAVAELEFQAKRAARPLKKLILSAAANAEHNFKLKPEDLIVKHVIVNSAVTMKRFTPKAFGRATVIRKRGSHVTVTLVSQTGATVTATPAKSPATDPETTTETAHVAPPAAPRRREAGVVGQRTGGMGRFNRRLFNRKSGT